MYKPPLRVADLFSCVRPLRWENDDLDFEYSIGGTGFLAAYRSKHFLITAKHCLESRDRNSLRVEVRNDSGVFNAIHKLHVVEGCENWQDMCLFEFDPSLDFMEDLSLPVFLRLDSALGFSSRLEKNAIFVVRGFPNELNVPDYENKKLKSTSISIDAKWDPRYAADHCGGLMLSETLGLTSFEGISGSPVFQFIQTANGMIGNFAGLVISTNSIMGGVRFISTAVIEHGLRRNFGDN